MTCCEEFINNNNNFTYIHDSLNEKKWLDHFLVSSPIASSTNGHEIIDVGDNTSDHLPIKLELPCVILAEPAKEAPSKKSSTLKWEKCSEDQKLAYSRLVANLLCQHPDVGTPCLTPHCQHEVCLASIQEEYNNLIELSPRHKVLPRNKPGVEKHWWSDKLTHCYSASKSKYRNIQIMAVRR